VGKNKIGFIKGSTDKAVGFMGVRNHATVLSVYVRKTKGLSEQPKTQILGNPSIQVSLSQDTETFLDGLKQKRTAPILRTVKSLRGVPGSTDLEAIHPPAGCIIQPTAKCPGFVNPAALNIAQSHAAPLLQGQRLQYEWQV
jgi:hypothetical protein